MMNAIKLRSLVAAILFFYGVSALAAPLSAQSEPINTSFPSDSFFQKPLPTQPNPSHVPGIAPTNVPGIPPSNVPGTAPAKVQAAGFSGLGVTSQQLGLESPFDFGVNYSDLTHVFMNGQYVLPLGKKWAVAVLGEYGADQSRFGGTLGFSITPLAQLKVSAERLTQTLPFNFDSGNINQEVSQNAYGARFQQLFNDSFWQGLNVGGYWAKAENQSLPHLAFSVGALTYVNYRNIAGATSQGLDAGVNALLTRSTLLGGNVYYDSVYYNTELTGTSDQNQQGLGGGLKVDQLLGPRFKAFAEASVRKIYDSYQGGVSILLPIKIIGLELSLSGQHLVSHNPTPDSNQVGFELSWIPDSDRTYDEEFAYGSAGLSDIAEWVHAPAVYMDRVLAVAEQTIIIEGPPIVSNLTPTSGDIAGGTLVTINGDFLNGVSSVTFGGVAASAITVVSITQITVLTPASAAVGSVNVVVTNPRGSVTLTNAYTYTVAVGDTYAGGIVYSVNAGGQTGQLVSATDDVVGTLASGPGVTWTTNTNIDILGATTASGAINTAAIVATGPTCASGSCAAVVCSAKAGGTWYLPSSTELSTLASNLCSGGVCTAGGFQSQYYWSSNQFSSAIAYQENVPSVSSGIVAKSDSREGVRCVKPF